MPNSIADLAEKNALRASDLFGSSFSFPHLTTSSSIALRLQDEYDKVRELPVSLTRRQADASATSAAARARRRKAQESTETSSDSEALALVEAVTARSGLEVRQSQKQQAMVIHGGQSSGPNSSRLTESPIAELVRSHNVQQPRPDWHAPWKLMRVISGHLGWVRALAVDPQNEWFASGAGDRTIKIWDLASGSLKLTLTGHIATVRGLAVSPRHPYLFSCGEDKLVKCWDLETNKVIRHYHGHLSGVYSLALHPTLDVMVTGGRDGVARVWDMRTRSNIHVLSGHTQTVTDIKCQEADPQIISSSLDATVRLWDLAAGKSMGVLTHHKKGVRALAIHPKEFTFASASTGSIKQWKCPEGAFMLNFEGHSSIINSLSVNEENVLFSGGDDGSMTFWDWKTGHRFQKLETTAQPGSLEAESGIFASTFDRTGLRLICGEADKTIKIWKRNEEATPDSHPVQWTPSLDHKRY